MKGLKSVTMEFGRYNTFEVPAALLQLENLLELTIECTLGSQFAGTVTLPKIGQLVKLHTLTLRNLNLTSLDSLDLWRSRNSLP